MAKKHDRQEEKSTDRLVSSRDFLIAVKSVIAAGTVGALDNKGNSGDPNITGGRSNGNYNQDRKGRFMASRKMGI